MKKLALLIAAAAAFLALVATAQAKEIVGMKVCGASGCKEITERMALGSENETFSTAQPGPYYTVELEFGEGGSIIHREPAYWLPASDLMRFDTPQAAWWKVAAPAALHEAASGIDAFVPKLTRVTVGGKPAKDPNSYLALLGKLHYAVLPSAKLHLTRIVLRAAQSNPWIDGVTGLGYDAKRRLLVRSDGYFRVPAALGRLVMARASLNSKATSGSGGGTALYAGLGVGALAAVTVLGVARHKKMT